MARRRVTLLGGILTAIATVLCAGGGLYAGALGFFVLMYAESGSHHWELPPWLGGLVSGIVAGAPAGIPASIYLRSLWPLVATILAFGLLAAVGTGVFYSALGG